MITTPEDIGSIIDAEIHHLDKIHDWIRNREIDKKTHIFLTNCLLAIIYNEIINGNLDPKKAEKLLERAGDKGEFYSRVLQFENADDKEKELEEILNTLKEKIKKI